jgi:glutamate 5-kinase
MRDLIKFGTEVLSHQLEGERSKKIDECTIYSIAKSIKELRVKTNNEVIIVTSGSALAGCYREGVEFPQRSDFAGPNAQTKYADRLAELSTAGTVTLSRTYECAFENYGLVADYCLITNADVENDKESPGIRRRLNDMLSRGRIPIINTNDFATIEELLPRYGENGFDDNDMCAYIVAQFSKADKLYIVTKYVVHEQDPSKVISAKKIDYYSVSNPPNLQWGDKSKNGRGGMKRKVEVACKATKAGIKTHIITLDMLPEIATRTDMGTTFIQ